MSKLKKMQNIANKILDNEKQEMLRHKNQQIKDYIEGKMIKGYSKEVAESMAKKLILNQ
tara:strand:- start:82 stop:258 length:177 start_codon:yes stop_codon:yes gene_type:complete